MLGFGDGVPKDGPVCWHEVHHPGGNPGLCHDLVDGVVADDGRVGGLPEHRIALVRGEQIMECEQK